MVYSQSLQRTFSSVSGFVLIWLRALLKRGSEARDLAILFDTTYYLANNPDVAYSRWNPRWHYLLLGASENRNPHPLFDTAFYQESYPDVTRRGMNPLLHYILHGASEGRSPNRSAGNLWSELVLKGMSSNPLVRYIFQQQRGSPVAIATAVSARAKSLPAVPETPRREAAPEEAKLRLVAASRDLSQSLSHCGSQVRAARAELIMFLDSDDLLDPGAIEKLCWSITRSLNMLSFTAAWCTSVTSKPSATTS